MKVTLSYQDFELFKHYCSLNQINIVQTEFNELICCNIELTFNEKDQLLTQIDKKQLNIQNIELLQEKYIKKVCI